MNIKPINKPGKNKTGELNGITVAGINHILGFVPNIEDDSEVVEHSWGFEVDGKQCGIWDYNGSSRWGVFSTFGDDEVFRRLFNRAYCG
jgi:hypothetical protein